MLVKQWRWYPGTGWSDPTIPVPGCHLLLAFGTRARLEDPDLLHILEVLRGSAPLVGCASLNDTDGGGTIGQGLVVTAVRFERSQVRAAVGVPGTDGGFAEGKQMGTEVDGPGMRHFFVFTDGPREHRSELIRGLRSGVRGGEAIAGGLICAGSDFEPAWVMVNDRRGPELSIAIGLLTANTPGNGGSTDGWAAFGPSHMVSPAHDSVLRELEGADLA